MNREHGSRNSENGSCDAETVSALKAVHEFVHHTPDLAMISSLPCTTPHSAHCVHTRSRTPARARAAQLARSALQPYVFCALGRASRHEARRRSAQPHRRRHVCMCMMHVRALPPLMRLGRGIQCLQLRLRLAACTALGAAIHLRLQVFERLDLRAQRRYELEHTEVVRGRNLEEQRALLGHHGGCVAVRRTMLFRAH